MIWKEKSLKMNNIVGYHIYVSFEWMVWSKLTNKCGALVVIECIVGWKLIIKCNSMISNNKVAFFLFKTTQKPCTKGFTMVFNYLKWEWIISFESILQK